VSSLRRTRSLRISFAPPPSVLVPHVLLPAPPGHHGWIHWFGSPLPDGGRPQFDMWPSLKEFDQDELYNVPGLTMPNGEQAKLFSSRHPKTVDRHFRWMKYVSSFFRSGLHHPCPGPVTANTSPSSLPIGSTRFQVSSFNGSCSFSSTLVDERRFHADVACPPFFRFYRSALKSRTATTVFEDSETRLVSESEKRPRTTGGCGRSCGTLAG
jgi:hypothetical protein